jgi:hypothetical protein
LDRERTLRVVGYRPSTKHDTRPRLNKLAIYLEEIKQSQHGPASTKNVWSVFEGVGRDDDGKEDRDDYGQDDELETFEDHRFECIDSRPSKGERRMRVVPCVTESVL